MKSFSLEQLFILDLANNHQGDLQHGKTIIERLGVVALEAEINAAIKFQFRQLESFIHPDYKSNKDIKHIPRFVETRLDHDGYEALIKVARTANLHTMCTPFDEESVDVILDMDIDAIKVASCSFNDWPLIEKIAKSRLPVVVSTGGGTISDIDKCVHILTSHGIDFGLEHCVSIYPTPDHHLQLNQIDQLRRRYVGIPIGWSTHEDPEDLITVQLAFSKGATIFERHVGLLTDKYELNRYSSSPKQISAWFDAYKSAVSRCGAVHRPPISYEEKESIRTLKRGVFAKESIKKGQKLTREKVFFAMPAIGSTLSSGEWRSNFTADKNYEPGEALSGSLAATHVTDSDLVDQIMLQVVGMLHEARITIGKTSRIELSHHYGLRRFREFGAIIVDVINRKYCKKLIIQLPRQKHPYHFHKKKEESFQVLHGEMEIEKNGNPSKLCQGDIFLVEPNEWHKFSTLDGVIVEEISTTHYDNDSVYEDTAINQLPRESRKTLIERWYPQI